MLNLKRLGSALLTSLLLVSGNAGLAAVTNEQSPAGKSLDFQEIGYERTQSGEFDELQLQAINLVQQGKVPEAKKLLWAQLNPKTVAAKEYDLYYLLALIDNQNGDYKGQAKNLQWADEALSLRKDVRPLDHIVILKRTGDAYYALRELKPALVKYKEALELAKALPVQNHQRMRILEAVVGVLMRQNNYEEAKDYSIQLVKLASERAADGSPINLVSLFWAQLEMLDILKKSGVNVKDLPVRQSVLALLEKMMSMRDSLESAGQMPTLEETQHQIVHQYMKNNPPSCLADYLWAALNWRVHSLPMIRWMPPAGVTPKALVLCVHGLGLENRSFSDFGQEMSKRGYVVYAIDTRGFGAWQSMQGQEDVDFDDTIDDIAAIVNIIKERSPNTPVFLLGESMGGGIALRTAVHYGKQLNGVIASVPSAERFQQKRMSMTVALHFLKGKDRPFKIDGMVVSKATDDKAAQLAWEKDPKGKMDMSPVELMKFALFMRTTTDKCKEITTVPAFVVQGLRDRLVKPDGTFEIYKNIQAKKFLALDSEAEHLIFETDHQNPIVIDALCSWIDGNSKPLPTSNNR